MRLQEAFSYVLGWHDGVCSYVNPLVLPFAFKKFLEGHPLFYLKRTSVSVEIALLDCRHCLYIVDDEGDLERVLFCCKIYGACAIFMGSLKCSRNLTEGYEEVHLVDDSDGEAGSCLFFHPRFMVLNKVASYSYEGDQHMEIPLPAIIPKEDNGKLIKCAEVGDEKVGKSRRAVDQFYAALSSQYKFIPYDFSFCTIGSSVPVPDAILESLKLCFSTGIVVDVDKLIHKDDFVWNSHWLPKYMADGAATVKITCDNYEGITAYLKQNNPMYKEIADDFAIVTIVIGQYVPFFAGCCAVSGFVLVSKCAMRDLDWGCLISHYKSCLDHFIFGDVRAKYMSSNIRSAIGSIMSRNGSHNIGSHVLAALSHNVGTMPDDRVLYQYIQHRMDYIATVTTDFPSWTQPTMFIGEMMKTFLSQRHLLEHIVGSEGLHAWQYQNPSWRDRDPEGCIQFHIRKLKEGKWVDFIDYAEYCKGEAEAPYKKSEKDTQTQYLTLSDDVALAIPGGVVGQHAFFTILENIIRNVAKHDWCTAKRDLKNMEIFIDFEDQEEDVRFCIWSKCSSANDNLVRSLEEKINASFIDKTGALRRENWGLAEMKISAGYLQRKDIGEIGGLDNSSSKGAEIIRPILVSENGKDNSLSYLGYEFRVAKPKTIAFVVSEAKELQHLFAEFQKNQDRVKKFRELGISILSENDLVAKAHKLDYEFVVLESLGEDQLGWDVPFRVLTATKTKLSAAGKIIACLGMDKYKSLLQGLFESGESVEDVANACKECKKEVLGSWCRHLIEDKRRIEKIGIDLIVQTSGTDRSNGAQRTLVQEVDVLKVVFSECFNTAVEQYKALNRLPDQVLHLLDYWKERNIKCQEDLAKLKDQCSTVRGWIAWWLEYLLHGAEADEGIQTKIDKAYLKHVQDGLRQFSPSPLTAKGCCNALEAFQSGGKRDVRAEIDRAKAPLDKELAGFIAFLGSFQAQADVFLRKYGERIVSLPREFVVDKQRSQKGFDWKAAGINVCFENASSGGSERKSIDYRRHFNANNDRDEQSLFVESLSGTQSYLTHLANLKDDDYVTITKLTESALTRVLIVDERVANFVRLHPLMARVYKHMEIYVADDVRLTDELRGKKFNGEDANDGESANGLTCIPIDFLKEARDRIGGYDGKKGLSEDDCKEICKEGKFSPDLIFKKLFPRSHRNMRKKVEEFGLDYDVLIVHQGLLDKLLPESIAHDDLRLAVFLELLKTVIPCVAITTGRGTPANIPSGAHLLPFSTIESTLFKQYPEKMTLIDTVMNILPVRRKSQEES